ncbi:family 43 glycosylhydrolase [Dyadobacter chenwenxiniae]|uniref:Family 43 glycosylhydrolase n=1 Tax=Dyadobacter chenwenxiniae TaxID=2906456 RepID=A0A9X1PHJ5_9BACT|nr:family 43 glycosylhydrolase [Dyadobacter chenwenxiniae]MCF0061200.1 family 43 glycosylhydrolase [Dyadobacter chenwenxiniae]UON81024.1 family 43 glycosylhydrolase [Dyadobacter chenwenxiniae]
MNQILFAFFGVMALASSAFCQTAQKQFDTKISIYQNPVFEPILADPTIIKADDGWFYAYGTMDDWGDGKGAHLVPVVRSKDLVKWDFVKDAFLKKPSWKEKGGIWAPDVVKVNGKYYMYYAYSTWGDANPGVGLAVADSAAGPFTDLGKLFLSAEVNVPNSIDPFYIEADGKKYVFWGSYSNAPTQGTYGVELSADGKTVPDLSEKFKIAAGDFEAVMIQKKGDYYYFFGSRENCCDGAKSKYHIRVGRSKDITGPFLDKDGKDLKERNSGSVLIQPNEKYAGTGHNARLITDNAGTDWLLYHAIDRSNPTVSTGANRRVLMLDKVTWKDNWPEILNAQPSIDKTAAPLLK